MSSICGGVISETKFFSNPGAYAMSMILPNKYYKKWLKLYRKNRLGLYPKDGKNAQEILDKHSWSAI